MEHHQLLVLFLLDDDFLKKFHPYFGTLQKPHHYISCFSKKPVFFLDRIFPLLYDEHVNSYSYVRWCSMESNQPLCCDTTEIHMDLVEQVRSQLPQDEILYDLAELFKIFGDSTRIKILYALLESELCVCDLAKLMEVSQSAVSHQLRVLKGSKLVKFRREGKVLYYSLADDHVLSILNQGMDHLTE